MISTLREGPEGLTVERRLPLVTRVMGGAAFSIVAARVAYFFRDSLAFARQASLSELKQHAPGLLLVAFLILIFAVPAWLIVFRRAGLVVDADGGTIQDYRHYGLFRRQRSIPVDQVERIRLWREVFPSRSGSAQFYEAALVLKNKREVLAVKIRGEGRKQAREIAQTLSRRLRVRLEDQL
jgi:hypothetical protein